MVHISTALVLGISAVFQVVGSTSGPDQPIEAADPPRRFSGRMGQLSVTVPAVPEVDLDIDGRLEEPMWQQAALLTDFTQYEPVEGVTPSERTEVRVFYTTDAIYFGIRAFDARPDLILARLGERDRAAFTDDWVRIMLDTFDDQRQAYVFYVNPLGLQTDGLWIEGMEPRGGGGVSIDFNPDFIWESSGRVTDDGWSAELKIPYVSLRFREIPVQNWGFNVLREVKRKGFKQSWAPLTKNVSSTLAQSGHFVGLQGLKPRRLIEVNPVVTGKRAGSLDDNGVFGREAFEPEFGVNGRYGITRNLVLDATVNPDFSQVEADDNQITVNERFALFYPEKRAFFLEGTEIFRTPRNLVHTRQIADPMGGAKVTGKLGSFNLGYLGALDESPRTVEGGDEEAVFNLLRLRRDVGAGSTVGLLYTDRTLTRSTRYNRVLSADARFLFGGRYTWTMQIAGSWTRELDEDSSLVDLGFDPLIMTSLVRSGRTFGWEVKFDDVYPNFRSASGFIPRVGDTQVLGRIRAEHFGSPGSALEQFNLQLKLDSYFDHDEFWQGSSPFEAEIQLEPSLSFKGERNIGFILRDGFFRFRPDAYATHQVDDGTGNLIPFVPPGSLKHLKAIGILPRARITNAIQVNGRLFYREVPIYEEAARGLELQVSPEVTVRPISPLQLTFNHTYSRIWRTRTDSAFSTVNISRIRVQYQFSRSLFLRSVVQYDLERRAALRDPTTDGAIVIDGEAYPDVDEGRFGAQVLLSYQPSPGTIFFIGYNRAMEGERSYRLAHMDPVEDALFVKLSYLFRM
jgi:Domain of unknown function (DUF5916)